MDLKTTSRERNIYLVIGFARSGSSLITRGLKALGIPLGDKLVSHTNHWNEKGFFEDNEIIFKIYVKLFEALGYAKRGILLLDKKSQLSSKVGEIRKKAIALLEQRFSNSAFYGFKNPNTSKLLPFWQSIFATMKIRDNYIITLRNPLSSAQSFSTLTELDLEICLLIWLMHTIPSIEDTQGKTRVVVSYELLLQQPREQLLRIKEKLHIPNLSTANEVEQFTTQFLDTRLNHHPFVESDLKTHPAMACAPLCKDVYALLLKTARDELSLESDEFKKAWKSIMEELDRVYPLYRLLDKTLQKNKALRKSLKAVNKSIFWKLLYPLRKIDHLFRTRREKARLTKRVITAYE